MSKDLAQATSRGSSLRTSRKLRLVAVVAAAALAVTTAMTVSAATAPTISVPANAVPCQTVWVAGSGFADGQSGVLTFNGGQVTTFVASATGSFNLPFQIPDTAAPNTTGRISAKSSSGTLIATSTLAIATDITTPTLWAPGQAAPGQQIVVGGGGFKAGETGNLTLNGMVVRSFTAESDQAFSLPFGIPAGQVVGTARISAKHADGTLVATTTLGIGGSLPTPPPNPTQSPAPTATPPLVRHPHRRLPRRRPRHPHRRPPRHPHRRLPRPRRRPRRRPPACRTGAMST